MYNVKVYDYGSETEYRVYDKPINSGRKDNITTALDAETETSDKKKKSPKKDEKKSKDRSQLSSMNRTINKVYELTRSNEWEYFLTLTFNPQKVDRYNYDACIEAMKLFIHRTKYHNPDMKYVIVPELHEDGAYHFHGLFSQIPKVQMIDSGVYSFGKYTFKKENIPEELLDKVRLIYNMERYDFGHSDMQYVEDSKRAASYLTKYITKELVTNTPGKKRYWSSKNLNKPDTKEMLLTSTEKEQLKEIIQEQSSYHKIVKVDAGDYKNTIEYIHTKTPE